MSHPTLHADATPDVLAKVLEEWATKTGDSESETTVTYSRSRDTLVIWSDYGPDIRDLLRRKPDAIRRVRMDARSVTFELDPDRWGGVSKVLSSAAASAAMVARHNRNLPQPGLEMTKEITSTPEPVSGAVSESRLP